MVKISSQVKSSQVKSSQSKPRPSGSTGTTHTSYLYLLYPMAIWALSTDSGYNPRGRSMLRLKVTCYRPDARWSCDVRASRIHMPYDLMDDRMKEFLTDLRLSGRHSSLVTGGARQHTVAHSTHCLKCAAHHINTPRPSQTAHRSAPLARRRGELAWRTAPTELREGLPSRHVCA
jgi:hypothetical protein